MKRSLLAACLLVACARPGPSPAPPPPERVAFAPLDAAASPVESAVVAEPLPPPKPPYDLAADLEDKKKRILADVSKKTRFEVVESVFLIASPTGQLGSSAVVSKAALTAYFNHRFKTRPTRAIAILLFETAKPYDAYCKSHWGKACWTPFGFYDQETRTVVMNVGPGIGTLTHELVHPIVESDMPQAPDWINEGLASLFEAFALPKPGEIRGQKNFRHPRLLQALRSKTERVHASLPALFAMTDKEFRGEREDLNYATARYFCQWMDAQGKLWPFYQAWRDDFAHDPTGERAFVATMGKKPEELDSAWAAWVRAL